jgi:cytochrome c2
MDPQTHLGKAVEINLDTKNATIFSSGLRNPQGLTISSEGLIWETEHGPIGGDELNVLQLGRNYGWPEVTYGVNYGGQAWPLNQVQGRHDKYTKPAYAFVPSIGISSLIETNSDEFPRWKGDLLVTSLKNQAIWRLRRDADRIIYSERIQIGQRLRDIQELPNGQLIVLTDAGNLAIIRRKPVLKGQPARHDLTITVDGYASFPKVFADEPLLFKPKDRWDSGGETFKAHCAGCHAVSDETIVGPPLADVVGREIGSIQGYPYSDELAGAGGIWTEQRLVEFLSNPQENFKETSMPRIILMAHEYNEIVKYLNETD